MQFALIGAAGFVAPRHLQAIHDTGNQLVAAVDPHDSVGILDRYFPDARFFTEIERFDRFLGKVQRDPDAANIDYLTICSPNHLHDAHIRLALRSGAHALCEKPLVINPWNLDALSDIEHETGRRVYTVLQLRLHSALVALKQSLDASQASSRADVTLTYITRRGRWYAHSWKGSSEKSGGVVMNIGIHFFDALLWLFGAVESSEVHLRQPNRAAGRLTLERADVRWFLSVDGDDLPSACRSEGRSATRSIEMNGQAIDFSGGFDDLHTQVYHELCDGRGWGIAEARPSIELVHTIRHQDVHASTERAHLHPMLTE